MFLYLKGPTSINQGAEIELPPREEFGWSNALVSRMHNLPREERIKNNEEVALGLTEEQVKTESQRCYRCVGKATVDESICYTAVQSYSAETRTCWIDYSIRFVRVSRL